jgi:hypothetical protein
MSMGRFLDQSFPPGRRPALIDTTIAVLIATVALAAFIAVADLVPSVWRFPADSADAIGAKLRRCEVLADPARRLGCYDEIAEVSARHPAKGANAPAGSFGLVHRPGANSGPRSD